MPLSDDELQEFLAAPRLAHFATVSDDGRPRVRPLWYEYEDGAFYFTTRMEVRYTGADVAAGSTVAISIASEDRPYRAVLARGRAEGWTANREGRLERMAERYGEPAGRR